jgi:hypothetical protein
MLQLYNHKIQLYNYTTIFTLLYTIDELIFNFIIEQIYVECLKL